MTRNKSSTENPQILDATVKIVVARDLYTPAPINCILLWEIPSSLCTGIKSLLVESSSKWAKIPRVRPFVLRVYILGALNAGLPEQLVSLFRIAYELGNVQDWQKWRLGT